jgi:hypothetical protein
MVVEVCVIFPVYGVNVTDKGRDLVVWKRKFESVVNGSLLLFECCND